MVRLSELNPGDHILNDSKHFLVKLTDEKCNSIELYSVNDKKHVVRIKKKDEFEKQVYRIDYDSNCYLYNAEQTLQIAEDESCKDTEWQNSGLFVTMTKCGRGYIIDDRCIMPDVVEIHCTDIVRSTSVDNGDHLLIKDEESGRFSSVLVCRFYHQTKIEVISSASLSQGRQIIDLTQYGEKYRVNYSHYLPSLEVNIRAKSQAGQDLLQRCADDCTKFIYWAKTGKELEISPDMLLQNSKQLCLKRPISYDKILSPTEIQVGDHLFWDTDKTKSYRKHVMVTECNVDGDEMMFRLIYCAKSLTFKERVKSFAKSIGQDVYRVNYPESLLADLAIKRARSQLGEHTFKPLARLWFVRWAKTGSDEGLEIGFLKNNTRPVTKSRISCFTQLNPGDYLVVESKMNLYHHYIVLSVESPTQCTVVESWNKKVQRVILHCENISDPNRRPWYYRVNYEKGICIQSDVAIEKAKDLINTTHLHPLSKCLRENFVHHLKTRESADIDTDELLDDRILLQRERVTSAMELKCGDHIE